MSYSSRKNEGDKASYKGVKITPINEFNWIDSKKTEENVRRHVRNPKKRALCRKLDTTLAKINKAESFLDGEPTEHRRTLVGNILTRLWETVDFYLMDWMK